jgi:hypothetical protein
MPRERLDKVPPLSGTPAEKTEKLREHVNRIVDEANRIIEAKDREIDKLRKEQK